MSVLSLIVRLTSIDRVKQIMRNKRSINYFNTRDLNKSMLEEALVSRMLHTKLFINEALSPSEHKIFKSIKQAGKNLGFRFIWHWGGKFFARWTNGTPEYQIYNPSDLNNIQNLHFPYNNNNHYNFPPRSDTSNNC